MVGLIVGSNSLCRWKQPRLESSYKHGPNSMMKPIYPSLTTTTEWYYIPSPSYKPNRDALFKRIPQLHEHREKQDTQRRPSSHPSHDPHPVP